MDNDQLRIKLIERVLGLRETALARAAELLDTLSAEASPAADRTSVASTDNRLEALPGARAWPHAPLHRLSEHGPYIVTGGTLHKEHLFQGEARLDLLERKLLELAQDYGWQIEAWAVFSNHYHFVGHCFQSPSRLGEFLTQLHADTARDVNREDCAEGREVWYNFWETQLTFEKSYLARLNYVHQNPVKHGLVPVANQYRWCSAGWFECTCPPSQVKTIYSFKIDQLRVEDDFEPC
jgi:putative transposase